MTLCNVTELVTLNVLWRCRTVNINMNLHTIIFVLLAILMCGCCEDRENQQVEDSRISKMSNEGPTYGIHVTCELTVKKIKEDVFAEVKFINKSDQPVPILRWKLLVNNKLTWAAFRVMRGSVEIPYRGRTIKRPTPNAEDFYMLLPGVSFISTIRLLDYYDVSVPGHYTVSYFATNILPVSKIYFEIESNTVEFEVD